MSRLALIALTLLAAPAFAADTDDTLEVSGRRDGGGGDRKDEPTTVGGDRDGKKGDGKKGDGKKGDGKKGDRDGDRDGGDRKKKGYTIDHFNPLYGTLVYGPKPSTHDKYRNAGTRKRETVVPKRDLPERAVDRKGSLAAGFRGGTMLHGYQDGNSYSDLGLGVMGRYRVTEAFGIEAGLSRHADALFGAERGQTLLSASGEIFLFPWNRMQPYALIGVTSNMRSSVPGMEESTNLMGPHFGLGVELAIGQSMALDLEGRAMGWTNMTGEEMANPAAVTATAGLIFHF